jgi:hypothetical protein
MYGNKKIIGKEVKVKENSHDNLLINIRTKTTTAINALSSKRTFHAPRLILALYKAIISYLTVNFCNMTS